MTPEQKRRAQTCRGQVEHDAHEAAAEITRQVARVAWVREIMAALETAQRAADQCHAQSVRGTDEHGAWARLLAPIPDHVPDEELEDLPEPPEQAQLDAIHAEIQAVIDHDRWPRHLHWSL